MYEQFYNLSAEPFRLSPDHRFCYAHQDYSKAKAYMAYAFMRAEGFVMITGQPGTGKTTLVGDLIESLAGERVTVASLVSTQLAEDDLLRSTAYAFEQNADDKDKAQILRHLNDLFLRLYREGRRALLIVDEAQNLTSSALEELRLLTNLQSDGQPLLQIFMLGQPELRELIHAPELTQLHQRIVAASHLSPLREDETRAYVEHRLRRVGWVGDPAISTAVFPIIYKFSEGIPRRINLICSRLFLHASVEQRHEIRVADAKTVVEELLEEQLSTRNLLHDPMFQAADEFEAIAIEDPAANTVNSPADEDFNSTQTESPAEVSSLEEEQDLATEDSIHEETEIPGATPGEELEAIAPEIIEALAEEATLSAAPGQPASPPNLNTSDIPGQIQAELEEHNDPDLPFSDSYAQAEHDDHPFRESNWKLLQLLFLVTIIIAGTATLYINIESLQPLRDTIESRIEELLNFFEK